MKDSKVCENCNSKACRRNNNVSHGGDVVYVMGLIGAAIFFIGQAPDFWAGVVGFLKAIIWPIFMVFEAFNFLIK